jgi:hypothetical protein
LQFIARNPFQAYRLPLWLAGGKGNLKIQLADRVNPRIETVPLRAEALALIRAAQSVGRPVYLASASDRRYVEELAQRIGGIAGIFGTAFGENLAGQAKADQLVAAFGMKLFDYVGDRPVDFAVWRSARKPLVVAHSASFAAKVLKAFPDAEIVASPRPPLVSYISALRIYQWSKNILIFLPMIAGHRFDLKTITATLFAFLCFCLAASGTYVINDLLDLPGDRDHPRKSSRAFAAGDIPITHGAALAALMMVGAFVISLLLPWRLVGILFLYLICTLGYSLLLKRMILIDVIMLGGLYTVRIYGGLAAIGASQTQWLLMFSLFLFLSLAIVKRCSELVAHRDDLVHGSNSIGSPIQSGGTTFDRVKIYAVNGDRPLFSEPLFTDSARQNFKPLKGSAALKGHIIAGAYRPNSAAPLWWVRDFPPKLISLMIDRPESGFRRMIANRPWLR